jgi:putative effector of murein hydrolase LrgA (UPF0299 family)
MLRGVALLLGFQLAGELTVWAFHLPLSGPICGMAALIAWLCWVGDIPEDLGKVADGLLSNMAILFVPVGAGAIVYADLFRTHWPAIVIAIVLGTLVTLAVTALTVRWAGRLPAPSISASTWPRQLQALAKTLPRSPLRSGGHATPSSRSPEVR